MNLSLDQDCKGGHGLGRPYLLSGLLLALYVGLGYPESSAFAAGRSQQERVLVLCSSENDVGICSDFHKSLRATPKPVGTETFEFYSACLDLVGFPTAQHAREVENLLCLKPSLMNTGSVFLSSITLATALRLLTGSGENRLMPESVVLYKEPPASEIHLWQILRLVLLVAAAAVLIAFLISQHVKRKLAEAGLEKSEVRYLAFVANSSEGISRFEAEKPIPLSLCEDAQVECIFEHVHLAECNEAFARMYGVANPGGIVGVRLADLLVPSDPQNLEFLRAFIRSRYRLRDHVTHERDPQGNMHWFENGVTGIIERDCLVRAWVAQREITDRKRAEEALRANEELNRATFEQAGVGIAHVGTDGRFLRVNDKFCDIVGYSREEMTQLTFQDITYPEDLEQSLDYLRKVLSCEINNRSMEKRYVRKDGSVVWANLTVVRSRTATGELGHFISVVEDITERKRAERALEEYEKAVENSEDVMLVLDRDYRHVLVNRALVEKFGVKREQVIGHTVSEVVGEEFFHQVAKPRIDACFAGGVVQFESVYPSPRQGDRNFIVSFYPVHASNGIERVCCIMQDITERKRAEKEIRDSRNKYQALIETTSDFIWEMDDVGRYIYCSPQMEKLWGLQAEAMIGKTPFDMMPVEQRASITETFATLVKSPRPFSQVELTSFDGHGNLIYIETSGVPFFDLKGKLLGFRGITRDITDRKGAEAEITERLRFETLLADISSRFVHVPGDQINEEINYALRRVCETLDLEMCTLWQQSAAVPSHITLTHAYGPARVPPDLESLNCVEIFPWCLRRVKNEQVVAVSSLEELPQEAARDRESWHQFGVKSVLMFGLAVGGGSTVGALSFNSVQAERVWPEPIVKRLQVVVQMFSTALARLDSERALRVSEERFRGLVENATVGIYRTTPDGRILAANPTLVKLLGYAEFESMAARNLEQEGFEPTYPRKEFRERMEREGQVIGLEASWQKSDGSLILVRESARAIRGQNGEILYYDGIVEDISERKRAEDALFEIKEQFRLLSESSLTGIYLIQEGRFRYVNPALARMFGYTVEEVVDRLAPLEMVYPDDRPLVVENFRRRVEGEVEEVRYEFRGVRKDGSVFPVEVHGRRIEHGGKIGVIGTLLDNTERKRSEQSLRELGTHLLMAQETERRRVALELHDDFSQRLALLAIDLEQLAQRQPARKHELKARLQAMWTQTQELTSDLHRLSRQLHPSRLEDLGLISAVSSYCHELSRHAGLDVKFSSADVPRDLPKQISLCIYRIVQEALGNVVKHSGVKTAEVELGGGPAEVQLVISDSGKGFVLEDAQASKGLGLISMQERVRYVGGSWSIEARPSGGTRVVVRIPVPSQQPLEEMAQTSGAVGFDESSRKNGSRTRVLLADDHILLLEAFKGLLEPEFEVVGAVADGRAALAAVEELKPELVVLDIAMPLLNGLDAARQIRAISPNVRVIFLTMNPDPEVAREAMSLGASGYLLKSSAASELRKAIWGAVRGLKYVTPGVQGNQEKLFVDDSPVKENSMS